MAETVMAKFGRVGAALTLVLGAAALVGGPAGTSGAQSSCASPYAPAGWATGGSGGIYDSSPGYHRPEGAETFLPGAYVTVPIESTPTVELDLPSGTVTMSHAGDELVASRIGDLDDDGSPEYWVAAVRAVGDPTAAWVVPGSTAAGTYDVDAVGIATWAGFTWSFAVGTTDWTGDGVDDLLLVGPDPMTTARTEVFDGPTVMAAGPGGDATGIASEFESPGVPLTRGSAPGIGEVFVAGAANDPTDPAAGESVWLTGSDGTTAFTTLPAPAITQFPQNVSVIDSGADGLFLVVGHGDRSGGYEVVWRLDDPCGGLPPVAEPAAANTVTVTPAITG